MTEVKFQGPWMRIRFQKRSIPGRGPLARQHVYVTVRITDTKELIHERQGKFLHETNGVRFEFRGRRYEFHNVV